MRLEYFVPTRLVDIVVDPHDLLDIRRQIKYNLSPLRWKTYTEQISAVMLLRKQGDSCLADKKNLVYIIVVRNAIFAHEHWQEKNI